MSNMSSGQQTSFSTDPTTGLFAGSLPDGANQSDNILSYVSEEATASMPFGCMLAAGTADDGALLMAAQADRLIGVLVYSQAYQRDKEVDSTGLKPKARLSVLARGRIWVKVTEAVTPASAVKVSEVGGTFGDSASANVTVDISKNARYLTTAGANELALLEFDMTGLNSNKSSDT